VSMTNADLEDLPEWAERAIEAGIPLMRLWTGEFVVGWPKRSVKPGPREMTVGEFLDRIAPAIKALDAEKKWPTRERVAESVSYSVASLHSHRTKWFDSWPETVEAARKRP
jgi:hypothetical protein